MLVNGPPNPHLVSLVTKNHPINHSDHLSCSLMQSSALHHMPTAFQQVLRACTLQAGQQPSSQFLASQLPLLQPLHTLITACLETPTAALTANPVDVALYEALADALAPVGRTSAQEEQRVAAESLPHRVVPVASLNQDGLTRERQLLHFVLGTYVRRYFCRYISDQTTPLAL